MNWSAAESRGVCTITGLLTVATCCTGNVGGMGVGRGAGKGGGKVAGNGGGDEGGKGGASTTASAGTAAGNCSGTTATPDFCAVTAADCKVISNSVPSGAEDLFHQSPPSNASTGTCNKSDTSKAQSKGLRMTPEIVVVGRSFIRVPEMAACRTVVQIIGRPLKRIQRAVRSGLANLLRMGGWLILRAFDSQPIIRLFTSLSL